jgi:hypothetical protein
MREVGELVARTGPNVYGTTATFPTCAGLDGLASHTNGDDLRRTLHCCLPGGANLDGKDGTGCRKEEGMIQFLLRGALASILRPYHEWGGHDN